MKHGIYTLLLIVFFISGFSQNSREDYFGSHRSYIRKEFLNEFKFMSDIMPGYNKLIDYVSVEILASDNGKTMSRSTSDTLSADQKNIFNCAEIGSEIGIKVKFRYKDPSNDILGSRRIIKEIMFSVIPFPAAEAEYPGGQKQMKEFIKENLTDLIGPENTKKARQAILKFTVNEQGEIADAKIFKTSSDPKIDESILEAVSKMPRWKPAKNSKGASIKQIFNIPMSAAGC